MPNLICTVFSILCRTMYLYCMLCVELRRFCVEFGSKFHVCVEFSRKPNLGQICVDSCVRRNLCRISPFGEAVLGPRLSGRSLKPFSSLERLPSGAKIAPKNGL